MHFKTSQTIAFCISMLSSSMCLPSDQQIVDKLKTKGFYELANYKYLQSDYNKLYARVDDFIEMMANDKTFHDHMQKTENEFLSDATQSKRYCYAPPSFRNYLENKQKRDSKIYFQFIKEHYEQLKKEHGELLVANPKSAEFLEDMLKVDTISKEIFGKTIDLLEEKHPGIKAKMYGPHKELTVITKVVRYEKPRLNFDSILTPDKWGTPAHFDKSGLSLIWNSDDDNDDSLLICENTQKPSLKELYKPVRLYSHKDNMTSTIMIPGAAFHKIDIDIKPTLHGVAPITKQNRHAIISFLLIPDIDMIDIKTMFEEPK